MGLYINEKPPCMDSDTMPPKQVGIQWTRVVAPNATVHPELYLEARSVHYSKNWLVRYGLYGQAYLYTNGIVIYKVTCWVNKRENGGQYVTKCPKRA